jgi:membrane-bound metal-dependent hydrolase YbcI (DUF457 family)
MGFGVLMAQPFKKKISSLTPAFLVGTLLPDLLDKPLFYLFKDHVLGTRSYGHTFLFLLFWIAIGFYLKSVFFKAMAYGVFTHFVLDYVGDALFSADRIVFNNRILFWPFQGVEFPESLYLTFHEQINRFSNSYTFWTETIGFILLVFFIFQNRRQVKI